MKQTSPLSKSELKRLTAIEPKEPMPAELKSLLRPTLRFRLQTNNNEQDLTRLVRATLGIQQRESHQLVSIGLETDGLNVEMNWPGVSAVTASRRPRETHVRTFDDYLPPWFGASFRPLVSASRLPEPRLFKRGTRLSPAQIFNDQRRILTATGWPHHCVGIITNSDGKQGSGTLVGPNLVLTASHVCPWDSINSGKGWWMTFDAHATLGNLPMGQSNVSDILWYRQVGESPDSFESAEDYAVLRLYDRLGDALGWMGGRTYNEDWNDLDVWELIGYPNDYNGNPAVEMQQSIEDGDSPGVFGTGGGLDLETEASILPGASGGPAWAWFQDGDRPHACIVGVVSGEEYTPADLGSVIGGDTENVLAGGSEMCDLVNAARSRWP